MSKYNPEQDVKDLPEWMQGLQGSRRPPKLEELFPGDSNASIRTDFSTKGKHTTSRNGKEVTYVADVRDGYVLATAAVSRTPSKSYDFVKDIGDFATVKGTKREQKIPVYHEIYKNEGMINNGINRSASLVSTEGTFSVQGARQGRRPKIKARDEISMAMQYWSKYVNANPAGEGPVTGARGISAIMEQGTRQALIEGSFIGYMHDSSVNVPSLGSSWDLPMWIQSISSAHIEIPEVFVGTGLEQFFWKPPRTFITKLRSSLRDEQLKEIIEQSFEKEILDQLFDVGKVLLDRTRVIHIKHRGTDINAFGDSFIEPCMASIAYKRSLQQLDFVTIESLINRIVIVKVGSDKPDSDYHNLETAQSRLNVLKTLYGEADGPNMHILWAGPDIDVIEVSAHDAILDIDDRHRIAENRVIMDMGVPKSLLDGSAGGGQVWASYEGYREALRSMLNQWVQALTALGERSAARNNFQDVELVYVPTKSVLADQTAGADLALRAHRSGLASLRRTIGEVGGDYDAERRNRLLEMGLNPDDSPENLPPDTEIFTPPAGLPGDTHVNDQGGVRDPGGEPGRRPDSQREDLGDERDLENRNPRDGDQGQ